MEKRHHNSEKRTRNRQNHPKKNTAKDAETKKIRIFFICTKVKTSHLFNKQGITELLNYHNNNINTVKSHKNPKKGNENPNWKGQKVAKFAT